MKFQSTPRRTFFKSSVLGLIAVSAGKTNFNFNASPDIPGSVFFNTAVPERYPAVELDQVRDVVGASHSDLEKVKTLVGERPELSNSTWDWGFGDFETALGAASHMGRKDIAEYLIAQGARPDIFSLVAIGSVDGVKGMVDSVPGIQRITGPHGITLLRHAQARMRRKEDMTPAELEAAMEIESYLVSLGDADPKKEGLSLTDEEKEGYVGAYQFGEGERDEMEVTLNMRKILSIARKGDFGKAMVMVEKNTFILESSPSIKVSFTMKQGMATRLTIQEPGLSFSAEKL
jgi:hypothetical protein